MIYFNLGGLIFCCGLLNVQKHLENNDKLSLRRGDCVVGEAQAMMSGSVGLASWFCYLLAEVFWGNNLSQILSKCPHLGIKIALTS